MNKFLDMTKNEFLDKLQIRIEAFFEMLKFTGSSKRNLNFCEFKRLLKDSDTFPPVFFLSTGRCGTKFFTNLLRTHPLFDVHHSTQPELICESRDAYCLYKRNGMQDQIVNQALSSVISASRDKLLYSACRHNKVYIETNNKVAFLAPALRAYFPHAKFVHIYRHPGEFIRSGIRRGWYISESIHELGRIIPTEKDHVAFSNWRDYGQSEKIAWLWFETNRFIEDFLSIIPSDSYFKFNFSQITDVQKTLDLLTFCGADDFYKKKLQSATLKPVNVQKEGSYPLYENWDQTEKDKILKICGGLSMKYGFQL